MSNSAWQYANGAWTEGADPVMDAWEAVNWAGGEGAILGKLDYQKLFEVGERPAGGAFEVWARSLAPRHVFVSESDDLIRFVYVDAYPDVLALAAQWSPLVRDVALLQLIRGLWESGDRHGLVEQIVRRAGQANAW